MVFKLSAFFRLAYLEMDIWFWSHHFWHLYRDGSAVFWVSSLVMGSWSSRVVFLEVFPWSSSYHLLRIYTYTDIMQLFSGLHIWRWIFDFHAIIYDSFTEMMQLFSGYHLLRWIYGFQAFILGAFTERMQLFLVHGYQLIISGALT